MANLIIWLIPVLKHHSSLPSSASVSVTNSPTHHPFIQADAWTSAHHIFVIQQSCVPALQSTSTMSCVNMQHQTVVGHQGCLAALRIVYSIVWAAQGKWASIGSKLANSAENKMIKQTNELACIKRNNKIQLTILCVNCLHQTVVHLFYPQRRWNIWRPLLWACRRITRYWFPVA